jgi:predicted nuclease of predicted toxin-antitoxin system
MGKKVQVQIWIVTDDNSFGERHSTIDGAEHLGWDDLANVVHKQVSRAYREILQREECQTSQQGLGVRE